MKIIPQTIMIVARDDARSTARVWAVASLSTFAAAAAENHKSQPAISKLVQNLEAELGLTLFDRAACRATLTNPKSCSSSAAQVMADTEALRSFGLALAGGGEPVVRLVLEPSAARAVLEVLREVQALTVRYELRTERLRGALERCGTRARTWPSPAPTGWIRFSCGRAALFRDVRIIASSGVITRSPGRGRPCQQPSCESTHAQVVVRDSARQADAHVERARRRPALDGHRRHGEASNHRSRDGLGRPPRRRRPGLRDGTLVALTVREFFVAALGSPRCTTPRSDQGPVAQALWSRLHQAHAPLRMIPRLRRWSAAISAAPAASRPPRRR